MKPSDIALIPPTPLTGVFDHTEAEQSAALLIMTLAAGDDVWQGVKPTEIGEFLKNHEGDLKWMNNPFFRPDFDDLIKREFAEWIEDGSKERSRPIRFTARGLRRLRRSRWNKKRRDFMDSSQLVNLYKAAERRWFKTRLREVATKKFHDEIERRGKSIDWQREYMDRFCVRAVTLIPRWRRLKA